jgi:hypothetical protein
VSSTAGHQFVSGRRTAAAGDGDFVDSLRRRAARRASRSGSPAASMSGARSTNAAFFAGAARRLKGNDTSTYSFEDYTVVKHVMVDNTEVARKAWHRTIFGREQA